MTVSNLRTGLLVALLTVGTTVDADIYKTYDENGNVVFTDRPPTPDAKPMSLRELSVVEAPQFPTRRSTQGQQDDDPDAAPTVNELRMMFRDFRLVSPAPNQNLWGTGQVATIAWDTSAPLTEDMSVIFYLDGQAVSEPTRAATFSTEPLDRGEHTARADLIGPNNRVIASAGPVTFFVMQNSRLFNQPRPGPTGP
jgi:hypothetical protein